LVCNISGGPFQFTATKPGKTRLGLEEAHLDAPRCRRLSEAKSDGLTHPGRGTLKWIAARPLTVY
jgi:hypothetical protein